MIKEFENPSNCYRPIPFWSWNDELEPEELRYQIGEMKEAGLGGYFMHARSGLKTPYLSEEWFASIKAGIEAGKEFGMDAWTYDEEGWPSGFAGGLVPAMSPDYHAKFMTLEEYQEASEVDQDKMIALYTYQKDKGIYHRVPKGSPLSLASGEVLLAIRRHTNEFYVDTLNKRAIEAFLQVTHEEYYKRFGEEFGTAMHGFFTDEPRLACNHFGELAWSNDLPEHFIKLHSYDILEHLPALFYDTVDNEKYRYDFWATVSDMFAQNYMRTIYDWCEAHNCKSTGHIMMEESIFSQMTSTAGVMPFYEYLHIPGIDWLRRMISSPVIGKQVGSVACQLGKKQVLTESFALCGWDVSFEELKWIAEWQFVNGVNQICQHLQAYTIKGSRKRDYPPSLFTQQTWWKEYRKFNDYLGRLCAALSEGDQTADVLLLHPMRSGFVSYDGTRTEAIRTLDQKFEELSALLSGLHISYHYGDETIIGKYGNVDPSGFVVGRISYKTVILPYMYAINRVTLKLLLEFKRQGGTIISMGQLPGYTNSDKELLQQLKEQVTSLSEAELRDYLMEKQLITLSITQNEDEIRDITYLQREAEGGSIYFMVNHNQEKAFAATVTITRRVGKVIRLKAEDGTREELSVRRNQNSTSLDLYFEPMQSYLLIAEDPVKDYVETKSNEQGCLTVASAEAENIRIPAPSHWKIDHMDLNSMTLDYCRYRIEDGEWQGPIPVIKLQNILLDLRKPCNVELAFDFHVSADLSKNREFYVIIEDAQSYQISVNDSKLNYTEEGWWKDKKFKKVTIKPYLRSGENTILLSTRFSQPQKVYDVLYGENVYETEKNKITYDIEIESIYLLGDFGVVSETGFEQRERKALVTAGGFDIVDAPIALNNNRFTTGGLLFFAGSLNISQTFTVPERGRKRVLLDLGRQNAPLIQIYVNGIHVKDSLWAPYTVDITDALKDGENLLELKLFASNRNLFGPHHHIDGECYNVGPESFTGKWSWVERKSEADATEIIDRNKNYWTDSYCFVEFGLHHE